MLHAGSVQSKLLFSTAALVLLAGSLTVRAVAPTPPSNLFAAVNGLSVSLTWTASANNPTQYILQAGFAPGQTAITVPLSGSQTTFSASAGAGTYYVRVVAVNADGTSAPSNEVTVVLTGSGGGCTPPSAPFNLRAIIRGNEVFIFWRAPAVGAPTGYSLQVGNAPGQTFTQFATASTTLNAVAPAGAFSARVIATSACGNSPASNELPLAFPSNTVRVADPDPGTVLGMPDVQQLVVRIHNENPGLLAQSCPDPNVRYWNNPWLDRIVDRLRQYDTRFGYNAKPTRTPADNGGQPVIAAGDEIAFFAGAGVAQGSPNVYAFDILFSHCGTPELTWRNIAPEPAIWTGAGRFVGDAR